MRDENEKAKVIFDGGKPNVLVTSRPLPLRCLMIRVVVVVVGLGVRGG